MVFLEFLNLFTVLFEVEDTETACLFYGHVAHCDSAIGVILFVLFEHIVIIHLIDVVTAQNHDVIGVIVIDKVYVLINCVCRTLVPFARLCAHIRRQNVDTATESVKIPRLTVAYVLVQFKRTILSKHAYRVDTAVDAIGKRKVDDAILRSERNGRFCNRGRENAQSRALSARE